MALTNDPYDSEPVETPSFLENAADTSRALGIGVLEGVVAPVVAGADKIRRSFRDSLPPEKQALTPADDVVSDRVRRVTNVAADALRDGMAEKNKKALDAALIPDPGQASILDTPFRSGALKLASMAAPLGVFALTSGVAAPAVLGGVQAIGQGLNEADKEAMQTASEILEEKYPQYKRAIELGLPEDLARKELRDSLQSNKSMLLAGAGGAAGGGFLAHGLRGQSAKSFTGALGVGTADAVAGGFASGAGSEAGRQAGIIEAGGMEGYEPGAILQKGTNAAFESAPLGVAFGGYAGARGAAGRRLNKLTEITSKGNEAEVLPPGEPSADKVQALKGTEVTTEAPPVEAPTALDAAVAKEEANIKQEQVAVIAPPREGMDVVKQAVHEAAKVNTKYTQLEGAINRALIAENKPPMMPGEAQRIISDMVKGGELTAGRRGYRTTRKPDPVLEPVNEMVNPPVDKSAQVAEIINPTEPVIEKPVIPGDMPSKAAEALPVDLPQKVIEPVITPAETAIPVIEAAPVEAPAIAKPEAVKPVTEPKKPAAVRPAMDAARKHIIDEIIAVTGTKPEAARKLSLKIPEKVKAIEAEQAEVIAKEAADRAAGKPRVFRAGVKSGPKVLDRAEILRRATEEAKTEVREADAKRKTDARKDRHAENDAKAKEIVEDQWKDEKGERIDEVVLSATEAKAGTGDAQAVTQVIAKARALVEFAREKGVEVARQPWYKNDPDNKNPTPWATHIKEAERLIELVDRFSSGRKNSDGTVSTRKEVVERVGDFITSTRALRAGDFEKSSEARAMRNQATEEAFPKKTIANMEVMRADEINANPENILEAKQEAASIEPNLSKNKLTKEQIEAHEKDLREWSASEAIRLGWIKPPQDGKWTQYMHGDSASMPPEVWDAINRAEIDVSAKDALARIKFGAKAGQFGLLADGVVKRLSALVGDTRIVVVPDEALEFLDAQGAYFIPHDTAFGKRQDIVVLSETAMNMPVVVIHEVVHVATSRQLHFDKALYNHVDALRKETLEYIIKIDPEAEGQYGFVNAQEFLAEALSNEQFQDILRQTPVKDANKYGPGLWGRINNAWEGLVRLVARSFGLNRGQMNALEAAMRTAEDIFAIQDYQRTYLSKSAPGREIAPS